jgi:antitoxin component YwqK of YwqJK toxin-antitoxin module
LHLYWYGENGQIKEEGNYKDGNPDGLWKRWYENGQMEFECNYKDGERDGLSKHWYENGQIKEEENYINDRRISKKCWDEDGNLLPEGEGC